MKRVLVAACLLISAFGISVLALGDALSRPERYPIGAPPRALNARSIELSAEDVTVHGWAAPGAPGSGVVLLLHGIRSDRRQMAERALWLQGLGYSVVMIDLPGHGESSGARISFGHREARGADLAMGYIAGAFPGEKVGVIGVSLGAAALMLSTSAEKADAIVLESMYATIEEALANRLRQRLGPAAPLVAPLLLRQLPLRLGITSEQLRPIDRLAQLQVPVLIAAGAADRHTTVAETRRLFDRANEPKRLWILSAVGHEDLHHSAASEYQGRVGRFLAVHLRL